MADEADFVVEDDVRLMIEIRQSVLSKNIDKKSVERALEFMREWNRARPAPET
jgi:hypothetical protein